MFKPSELFELRQTEHAALFAQGTFSWDALKHLAAYLRQNVKPTLTRDGPSQAIGSDVVIGAGTMVEEGAVIKGPAIIGKNCEIRAHAYIRSHVLIGDRCVIGHASEIKHSILFNGCQVPHFNYVGDSILGYQAHLGAGVKISNLKLFPGPVTVEMDGVPFDTGLEKMGALVGDFAEIGCDAVLNPGSIIGRNSVIYPQVSWRGILPANLIVKNRAAQEITAKRFRGA